MDLRHVEEAVKNSKGGLLVEKKEAVAAILASSEADAKASVDLARALQLFLDHIPISSIPDIIIKNPFPEVEAKTTDEVGSVIRLLFEKNIKSAPIVHKFGDAHNNQCFSEFIGLLDLDTTILWFLQEYDNTQAHRRDAAGNAIESKGFFSILEQNPPIVQTKVGELAKFLLWEPFFPIHVNDSLLHVLLLLSKHRLQVVPVTEQSESEVFGFVSQNAVIRALLQASGLEWFDSIADKSLSEYRFENEQAVQIHGDQSVAEAIHVLWENRIGLVAVMEPDTGRLIGSVRSSDVYRLLEDDELYSNRKNMKVKDFIQLDAYTEETNAIPKELAALPPERTLGLQKNALSRMISPATNRKTDTLKKAMKDFAETQSNFL